MGAPRLMIVVLGAAALVVGGTAALALGSWWILVAVLALHALGSAIVVGYGLLRASESYDKPDPVTEARIEEEARATRERRRPPQAARAARDTARAARDREAL